MPKHGETFQSEGQWFLQFDGQAWPLFDGDFFDGDFFDGAFWTGDRWNSGGQHSCEKRDNLCFYWSGRIEVVPKIQPNRPCRYYIKKPPKTRNEESLPSLSITAERDKWRDWAKELASCYIMLRDGQGGSPLIQPILDKIQSGE